MPEYIERDRVLAILSGKNAAWDAYSRVKEIHPADVRPVKHGKWITVQNGRMVACSSCGAVPVTLSLSFMYCPYCGAEMEVGDRE